MALGIHTAQPALVGSQPHCIPLARHRPHVVAAQRRLISHPMVGESLAARVQDADPAAFGRDPYPIQPVHQQGLHVVGRQACRIVRVVPPHPHPDTVVARQSVCGRDPQVTRSVVCQCLDRGGGQPLGRTHHAKARALGNGCLQATACEPEQDPRQQRETTWHAPSCADAGKPQASAQAFPFTCLRLESMA